MWWNSKKEKSILTGMSIGVLQGGAGYMVVRTSKEGKQEYLWKSSYGREYIWYSERDRATIFETESEAREASYPILNFERYILL